MKSLLELVQIYLHVGNDGSEFAQLQIYQMLIQNMKISPYSKVISKHHTLDDLEEKIIDCIREMRECCYPQTGSPTLFSQSGDDSQSRKESTQVSSMVRPRNTAMKRLKRRIISHDRPEMNSSDGSDSFDESEVNRNRAQHVKNRGPGLFDLIRQRKQRQIAIKDNDGRVSHQQKDDEPEIALEQKSSPPDATDRVLPISQAQEKSFETNDENGSKKHSSEQKNSKNLAITKSLNNSKIPVPFPSSSDETDSEKNELLQQAATSGHSKATLQNSTENSIRQNPRDNADESSKKPTESATVRVGSSSSSDSDFNKTPKSSPKQNKTPASQHEPTPSKPANESLTKKKLMSENFRKSADTDSTSESENEKSPVVESKMNSVKQVENSRRKKVSPKRKNKESESEEEEEESTSSAKLLARTAARKGTHDPTRTTAITRSKMSRKTTHSSSDGSSSDSENEKKSTSLNRSRKLPQTKSQLTSKPVDPSDSSSEELEVSKAQLKTNLQEKTAQAIASKSPSTENKSISKMKEASEDSSSSDDEMFEMIKAKRQTSRAGSVHGSIHSMKHASSDSDSDSDQFR